MAVSLASTADGGLAAQMEALGRRARAAGEQLANAPAAAKNQARKVARNRRSGRAKALTLRLRIINAEDIVLHRPVSRL